MECRNRGLVNPLLDKINSIVDSDESDSGNSTRGPTGNYVHEAKAMSRTLADVKELSNSFVFEIDMPGLKSGEIGVQVEDENVLVVSGERKRGEENEGMKYVRMERKFGKFVRKFVLPENADTDKITAVSEDGVLTVTVSKLPPPEQRKPPKIVEVTKVA